MIRRLKYLEFLFLILALPSCRCCQSGRKALINSQSRPYVIGHRGMFLEVPENTLAAFSASIEKGIGIEFDVWTTKDNKLIIIYDGICSRTTNGPDVTIRELKLSEIKLFDAGAMYSYTNL